MLKFKKYFDAGYPAVALRTVEEQRCVKEIKALAESESISLCLTSITQGVIDVTSGKAISGKDGIDPEGIVQFIQARASQSKPTWIVVVDFHPFLKTPVIWRRIKDACVALMQSQVKVIFISPDFQLPPELEHEVVVLDVNLPDKESLKKSLNFIVDSINESAKASGKNFRLEIPEEKKDALAEAALGMTTTEAENAFSLSFQERRDIVPDVIIREKCRAIAKSGVLELYPSVGGLENVGGLRELTGWLKKVKHAFSQEARDYGLPVPKGILILGVQGCISGDTVIFDPVAGDEKTVKERFEERKPFSVLSKTEDGKLAIGNVLSVFKYEETDMYEVKTYDGKTIKVTSSHKFSSPSVESGWISVSEVCKLLAKCESVLLETISDTFPEARFSDAHYLTETNRDFQSYYPFCHHLCGEQPHQVQESDRDVSPLSNDVHEHIRDSLHLDANQLSQERNRLCQRFFHPSSMDFYHLSYNVHESEFGFPLALELQEPYCHWIQRHRQFSLQTNLVNKVKPPSHDALLSIVYEVSYQKCNFVFSRVKSVKYIGKENYYDFHVPVYNNYLAHGFVNHNCGKSLTAKSVASEWGFPLIRLDVGKLFGGIVGETEQNTRRAISLAEAIAPCVLWIDEVDKGLATPEGQVLSGGEVTRHVVGYFCTWMQEKTSPVYVVATANSVTTMPPELLRKGRFDEIWFVDLPTFEERIEILNVICRKYKSAGGVVDDIESIASETEGFSGAELEQAIIEAMHTAFADGGRPVEVKDVLEAVSKTSPLSKTREEEIESLRRWATGRARPASAIKSNNSKKERRVKL